VAGKGDRKNPHERQPKIVAVSKALEVLADLELKVGEDSVFVQASGSQIQLILPSLGAAQQFQKLLLPFDLNGWKFWLDRSRLVVRILVGKFEIAAMGFNVRPTLVRNALGWPPIQVNWLAILSIWMATRKS
jgi:hypothetical protein